jgi:hypothetical protein
MNGLTIRCDECGELHPAEPAHLDRYSGAQLYAVVCPVDWLTDYYTAERLEP